MPEVPTKLTVEQQLLVSAVADELSDTTSIHEQAVLRMFAVASEHNLNASNLIQDLGVEMKSKTAFMIPFVVDDLRSGLSAEEALARTPGVVPKSAVIALDVAKSRGLEKPLSQALLKNANRMTSGIAGADNLKAIDQVTLLALKSLFVLYIILFLMMFIVPQFKDMFEEFGIELPLSMQSLIWFISNLVQIWFVHALLFIAIGVYCFWRRPKFFTSFFTRWIPNRWQQPVLTKRVQKDLSLAWVVQTNDNLPATAMRFINDNGVSSEELTRLSAKEKKWSNSGVVEAIAKKRILARKSAAVASTASSPESAAWMMRQVSKASNANRRERGLSFFRVFVWIINLGLMALAAWAAVAIFFSLLTVIRGVV